MVKQYLNTLSKMLVARGNKDEHMENALLDELDVIWYSLTDEEKREVNVRSVGVLRDLNLLN
jgi:hypothetical protein